MITPQPRSSGSQRHPHTARSSWSSTQQSPRLLPGLFSKWAHCPRTEGRSSLPAGLQTCLASAATLHQAADTIQLLHHLHRATGSAPTLGPVAETPGLAVTALCTLMAVLLRVSPVAHPHGWQAIQTVPSGASADPLHTTDHTAVADGKGSGPQRAYSATSTPVTLLGYSCTPHEARRT